MRLTKQPSFAEAAKNRFRGRGEAEEREWGNKAAFPAVAVAAFFLSHLTFTWFPKNSSVDTRKPLGRTPLYSMCTLVTFIFVIGFMYDIYGDRLTVISSVEVEVEAICETYIRSRFAVVMQFPGVATTRPCPPSPRTCSVVGPQRSALWRPHVVLQHYLRIKFCWQPTLPEDRSPGALPGKPAAYP